MKKVIDKILSVLGVIFLVSILPILIWATFRQGNDAIVDLAVEYQYCEAADSCSDSSFDAFTATILDSTKYSSARQVAWCLGVDSWAETHVRRGGWLVSPMMWLGYKFCPID